MKTGDRVRFVKAHHAMNVPLKAYEGGEGTIDAGPSGPCNDEWLVEFDEKSPQDRSVDGRWWIKASRLVVVS
jgi:hypothetical protein